MHTTSSICSGRNDRSYGTWRSKRVCGSNRPIRNDWLCRELYVLWIHRNTRACWEYREEGSAGSDWIHRIYGSYRAYSIWVSREHRTYGHCDFIWSHGVYGVYRHTIHRPYGVILCRCYRKDGKHWSNGIHWKNGSYGRSPDRPYGSSRASRPSIVDRWYVRCDRPNR